MCGFMMCVYIGMCYRCGRLGARVVDLALGDTSGIVLRLYLIFSREETKPYYDGKATCHKFI